MIKIKIDSSFRDPSGFIYRHDNLLLRQINKIYSTDYDLLIKSGLYKKLSHLRYLISHTEISLEKYRYSPDAYKIIQPEKVQFISYPYEWCFSQLKDAALLTLKIQKIALELGMSLKDASAFNIQFVGGKPILIDTLSFEKYKERQPWIAYRQFTEHFLSPLALMAYKDIRLGKLFQLYLDGVPLDLTVKLLPFSARIKPGLLFHLFLHASAQKKHAVKSIDETPKSSFSRHAFTELLDSLEGSISGLSINSQKSHWSSYYEDRESYTEKGLESKRKIVKSFIEKASPIKVWDIGANTGYFSQITSSKGIPTIAFDSDITAIEENYKQVRKGSETNMFPLFLDITNPTPSLGWENRERQSLYERGPTDLMLTLAIIHHLALTQNIPFSFMATSFAKLCNFLIIEYIPLSDPKAQKLLQGRKSLFTNYTKQQFEKSFSRFFTITDIKPVNDSKRIIYLMQNKTKLKV